MEFTAQVIADFLKGEIEGNPGVKVNNVSKIEDAAEGTLAFLANPKYEKHVYHTNASIVLVNKDFKPASPVPATLIRVDNAYEAFASLLNMYEQSKPRETGMDDKASIDDTAKLGEEIFIGAFTFVGRNASIGNHTRIFPQVHVGENVQIGENCIIYPGVKIYNDCKIGDRCIIHAGTVIGSDGFGFAPQKDGSYKKIPQLGNVIIEDDVELGANVAIDRAVMGSTVIEKGVKVDNLVQIAHNVKIGAHTILVSQVGIAGSSTIGKYCTIAGQVGIVGHITIADKVTIASQSGVSNSIKNEGEILLGSPAIPASNAKRSIAVYRNLPEMYRKINMLERELAEIKNHLQKE